MEETIEYPSSKRFKGEILRRVYRIWLFRKMLPVIIAEVVGLAAILYIFSRTVFIQRVLENALSASFSGPTGILSFGVAAFSSASGATQILSVIILVLIAFILRHLTQALLRLILVKENYFELIKK
ncbi:MAG: hypothetical protein HYT98_04770 [Candidatus Sungbacteria bacterium]|nr:hypothetical protein [Candidatus Sungbacteria bacterium]